MKKNFYLLLVLALLLTVVTAVSAEKDTLTVLSSGAFTGSWDPTGHTILANIHNEWVLFDRLMEVDYDDPDRNIIPRLATEWHYLDDGYTLELKLREGVKFHDGTTLDAEDVKLTIERFSDPSRVASAWWATQFEGEVVDEFTVRLAPMNKTPFAPLTNLLCFTPIMSADDIKNEAVLMNTYNGTGPYKFVSYENETVTMKAFDEYWDEENKAHIPNVIFKYVADPATRLAAVQTGEADITERVEVEQIAIVDADPNLELVNIPTIEQKNLVFKYRVPPMDNEKLRLAIAYAIDRETIVDYILEGNGVLADSFVSHVAWGYAPADGFPTYDPEKAAELLAEAGYPNGEGLPELTYTTSVGFYPKTKEYGEYIVSNLADIGIKVKLVPMETSSWEDALYQPESAHMTDTGWCPPGLEPDLTISAFYRGHGQVSFVEDPELDAVLDKEATELDPDKRKQILAEEVFPAIASKVPHMTLFDSTMIYAMGKDVKGFNPSPTTGMMFNKIYFGE